MVGEGHAEQNGQAFSVIDSLQRHAKATRCGVWPIGTRL